MVPLSVLSISINYERLTCDGFSHSETIRFGSLEFIVDRFGGPSLSPRESDLDAALMGSTRGRSPSPLWAITTVMIETSVGQGTMEVRLKPM
jgi:hypothetical protein